MISICIPVFNYDVTLLVKDLSAQAVREGIPFEIRILDDCSDDFFRKINVSLQSVPGVVYRESSVKLGRAAIRNKMAAESVYPYLLFMDCDSVIPDDQYLARYLSFCRSSEVVVGGRCYQEQRPPAQFFLHWYYGVHREARKAAERNKHPYRSFMTNNFLIPKKIFNAVPLDETLRQYGHEDTLMGYLLQKKGIPVIHIDNPLCHAGLETAEVFLSKTEKALENLFVMGKKMNFPAGFVREIRVLKAFSMVKKAGLQSFLAGSFCFCKKWMQKHLMGRHPSLFVLDLYKLGYLCEYAGKEILCCPEQT